MGDERPDDAVGFSAGVAFDGFSVSAGLGPSAALVCGFAGSFFAGCDDSPPMLKTFVVRTDSIFVLGCGVLAAGADG